MTVLWLDDKPMTIDYEIELIREMNPNIVIKTFIKIDELLVYLETNEITKDTIFIIDVMLINETEIDFRDTQVAIPEELMAGVILYEECLDRYFHRISTILYTSRGGGDQDIFQEIQDDERFEKTLFVVGKEELDTKFKETLKKLRLKTW